MKINMNGLSRYIWMALLVAILLFPAISIDQLKLSSCASVTTPVSADGGAGWAGDWIIVENMDGGAVKMTLTQSGNNVTGYSWAAGRKVACTIDPGNPNIARGNWDASNRMITEMTLSPDGQSITVLTGFSDSTKRWTFHYNRQGSGTSTTPGTSTPTGACTGIEGTWDVMFHTSPGHMDVTRSASGYTGHVYLVSWLGLETLKNITYDPQTGAVSFYRDSGNQTYTGTLSANSMSGTFIDLGHPGYKWSATRTCASTETGTGSGTGSTTGTGTGTTTSTGWSGIWNYPSWGNVTITQNGNQLTCVWANAGYGTITGTVSGNKFTGIGSGAYAVRDWELTLAPDGQSMTGTASTPNNAVGAAKVALTRVGTGTGTSTTTNTSTGAALIAESRTADPNSIVQVPVRLDNASNIGSMNFVLTYNAQVLKVTKVDTGSLLSGALFTPNYNTPPVVRFGLATSGGISGSGPMGYIQFQVIGAAGSSSPLTLSEVSATDTSGAAVAVTTQNGTVTVTSGTPGSQGGKVKGDYNGDGKLTEMDALAALKMSVKLLTEDLTLDLDGNGKITAEDARLILKKAVGK
jgi:hypothetical protein